MWFLLGSRYTRVIRVDTHELHIILRYAIRIYMFFFLSIEFINNEMINTTRHKHHMKKDNPTTNNNSLLALSAGFNIILHTLQDFSKDSSNSRLSGMVNHNDIV